MDGQTGPDMEVGVYDANDDGSELFLDDADTHAEEGDGLQDEDDSQEQDEELDEDEPDEDGEQEDGDEEEDSSESTKPESAKQPERRTVKIKFNGEEREIDPFSEESASLYQKGLNYEKVASERDKQKAVLEKYAKANNMTVGRYLQFLDENHQAAAKQAAEAEIRAKYPEAPEELIQEMAATKVGKTSQADTAPADEDAPEESAAWEEFAAEYPQVKDLQSLPKEVQDMVAEGKTPLLAMRTHERNLARAKIAELEAKAKADQKNQTNRDKSIGSAKSSGASAPHDPFLEAAGLI